MPLSMVKELSQGSLDGNRESTKGRTSNNTNDNGGPGARTLKRSPYLSEMTKTVDTDLMALLSRPSGVTRHGGGHALASGTTMMGGVDFLQLKRPAGFVGSAREDASEVGVSMPTTNNASSSNLTGRPLPSALRSRHQLRTTEHSQANPTNTEMKQSTSVTFSHKIKQGIRLGLVDADQPDAVMSKVDNATAAPIGREWSVESSSTTVQQRQGVKNQFPIYFHTIKETHVVPPSPLMHDSASEQLSSSQQKSLREPTKNKAKSANTLQYYYKAGMGSGLLAQNLLRSTGLAGEQKQVISKSSRSLTFRDMLDEGDGKEGDLNLHLRNEQWKVFQVSGCGSGVDHIEECDDALVFTPEHRSGSFLGFKRVLTRSSSKNSNDNRGYSRNNTTASPENNTTENTNGIPPMPMTMQIHPKSTGTAQMHPNLVASHRACVSANDLAVFRRAASRMKMSPQIPTPSGAHWIAPSQSSHQLPGETLGAAMLSRLPPGESTDCCTPVDLHALKSFTMSGEAPALCQATILPHSSPLSQMMANKMNSRLGQSITTGVPPLTSLPSASKLMQRRVHTVSAGLAYGSAGFQIDTKTRLSRFELDKETSTLAMSSQWSGHGGRGRNEEWG
ncbi:hypothetical protein HJC23_004558 [Cyclotella cryptica]|uniref:Uncharacterized protein n=1 Tax=Cyclotella cryptica TaxID=29204 RepID=A0ABD3QC08_9STRA|eukprot:CCRYP_007308-RA/>CCRYP_007308-RA protein AED:0.01 eAED:0.01 QI:715/1/1/1/0/0/2/512/617